MIAKAFTDAKPSNLALLRGWEAEKQMAFYLARAFEPMPDVLVFNGLRFPAPRTAAADDHVQIDHLVLHPHGAVIVESKASGDGTGEFTVDARGQWMRRASPTVPARNMPSPVTQAKLQADALRRLLNDADPPLLGKIAGMLQQRFGGFPIRVLVALSNQSRLSGEGSSGLPDVMKADSVIDAVRAEIQSHRGHTGVIGLLRRGDADKGTYSLRDSELQAITTYLLGRHVGAPSAPRTAPPPAPLPARQAERLEALACRHCRSVRVHIEYRRDYCLLCEECGKFTPLDRTCSACGKPATIRKSGPEYARVCDKPGGCETHVVFWRGREQ